MSHKLERCQAKTLKLKDLIRTNEAMYLSNEAILIRKLRKNKEAATSELFQIQRALETAEAELLRAKRHKVEKRSVGTSPLAASPPQVQPSEWQHFVLRNLYEHRDRIPKFDTLVKTIESVPDYEEVFETAFPTKECVVKKKGIKIASSTLAVVRNVSLLLLMIVGMHFGYFYAIGKFLAPLECSSWGWLVDVSLNGISSVIHTLTFSTHTNYQSVCIPLKRMSIEVRHRIFTYLVNTLYFVITSVWGYKALGSNTEVRTQFLAFLAMLGLSPTKVEAQSVKMAARDACTSPTTRRALPGLL
jgi:hypothetical protein